MARRRPPTPIYDWARERRQFSWQRVAGGVVTALVTLGTVGEVLDMLERIAGWLG